MRRLLLWMTVLLPMVSCGGGSPTKPSEAGSTGSGSQGQTVSAIDGAPIPNLSIDTGATFRSVTSDASGLFPLDPGTYHVVVRGGSVVDRDTRVTISGSRVRVSMIPVGFDL